MKIELTKDEIAYIGTAIRNQLNRNKDSITNYVIPQDVLYMMNNMNIALTNVLTKIEVQDEKD